MTKLIIVSVGDGGVTAICDENQQPLEGKIISIDYDAADQGSCPVCNAELDERKGKSFCRTCGYKETLDNGVECAIKFYTEHPDDN